MLISKRKRPDGKGFICHYDTPQTPAQRALADPSISERVKARIRKRMASINSVHATINSVHLYRLIVKKREALFRLQAAYEARQK